MLKVLVHLGFVIIIRVHLLHRRHHHEVPRLHQILEIILHLHLQTRVSTSSVELMGAAVQASVCVIMGTRGLTVKPRYQKFTGMLGFHPRIVLRFVIILVRYAKITRKTRPTQYGIIPHFQMNLLRPQYPYGMEALEALQLNFYVITPQSPWGRRNHTTRDQEHNLFMLPFS